MAGTLVEIDPTNVTIARRRIAHLGLALTVVESDAGTTDAYAGLIPADLLLLSGIVGNISAVDIERLVYLSRQLCAPGATLIWTRGAQVPTSDPTSADGSSRRVSRKCSARSGSKARACGSA